MSKLEQRIKLTLGGINHNVDEVLYAFEFEVEEMRLAGMSEQAILAHFATPEAVAAFRNRLVNDLNRRLSTTLNQLATNAYLDQTKGLSKEWRWVKEPTAQNCATCVANNGRVQTMAEWQSEGVPGAGATICDGGCRCYLEPV